MFLFVFIVMHSYYIGSKYVFLSFTLVWYLQNSFNLWIGDVNIGKFSSILQNLLLLYLHSCWNSNDVCKWTLLKYAFHAPYKFFKCPFIFFCVLKFVYVLLTHPSVHQYYFFVLIFYQLHALIFKFSHYIFIFKILFHSYFILASSDKCSNLVNY